MSGFHEFVIRGGQTVTAGQMDAFRRKLPFLKVKAELTDVPELPHLKSQTNFLVRYAEDVLDGVYPCSDLQAIAETVFALGYLLKEVDIIPDSVPNVGLVDDSLVLRAVLMGHESEFRAFAKKSDLDFNFVTTES
ncbi:MAG: YkvA family protein [Terrimicrobiaceae bacterium]